MGDADIERIENLSDFDGVRSALGDLPSALSQAVWLRIGLDLSYPEVAARLGCSEGPAVSASRGGSPYSPT